MNIDLSFAFHTVFKKPTESTWRNISYHGMELVVLHMSTRKQEMPLHIGHPHQLLADGERNRDAGNW